MPIYEYICHDCDTRFEKLRPVSQANDTAACPHCAHQAERVLSVFSSVSTGAGGVTVPVGGSSCSGCSSGSCSTCGG